MRCVQCRHPIPAGGYLGYKANRFIPLNDPNTSLEEEREKVAI